MDDIFIIGAARTAIGSFGGGLSSLRPAELGAIVIKEAIARAGVSAGAIENVVLGNVIATQPKDAYVARLAAVNAGVPHSAPAMTVNRLCGSGLQAIISAAQGIALGEHSIAIGAGSESMSNAPHHVGAARFGQKLGPITMGDAMLGALTDPFDDVHMGITAENVAQRCDISREDQDALAAQSHARAAHAIAEGRFKEQIVSVEITSRKGTKIVDRDEHVRPETTAESLGGLRAAFKKDGTVTAGNASGINDGAAAVVLASGAAVKASGAVPLARIVGWGSAGIDPAIMGLGPVNAVPVALKSAGLNLDRMDVIESNEAFAAQACGVAKELGLDPAKTNPNGSGIALGHPIGATGAILTVKAIYELKRTGGKFGLITMCIGGGQGIAMVIENMS